MLKKMLVTIGSVATPLINWAQCAMCRTQVKNNVSGGETSFAEGLNAGIMFLFFTPYVIVFLLIFLWFKYSKVNEGKVTLIERLRSQMSKMP